MADIPIHISASGAGQVAGEFSDIERAAGRAQGRLDNFGGMSGLNSFIGRVREAKDEMSGFRDAADAAAGFGAKMAGVGAAGGAALIGGLKMSLDAYGEEQQIRMGLESQLGSKELADQMFGDIQNFAMDSPFDFSQSAKAAQKLLAMGFAGDEIIPTLNSVGNAVSAAGGDTDAFTGVLTALGQIRTKGKMSQEELNQIGERGISVRFLADKLGLTAEQMGNIGNESIDAKKGIDALVAGFGEIGGGNAMAKQMETIPGQFSTLMDSAHQTAAAVGEVFSADASNLIGGLTKLLDKTTEFVKQNPELVKTIGTIAGAGAIGAVTIGGGLMIGGGIAKGASEIMSLVKAFKSGKGAAEGAAGA